MNRFPTLPKVPSREMKMSAAASSGEEPFEPERLDSEAPASEPRVAGGPLREAVLDGQGLLFADLPPVSAPSRGGTGKSRGTSGSRMKGEKRQEMLPICDTSNAGQGVFAGRIHARSAVGTQGLKDQGDSGTGQRAVARHYRAARRLAKRYRGLDHQAQTAVGQAICQHLIELLRASDRRH